MERLNILIARLRGLLRREAVIEDIEDELRSHIEWETQTNIERGMKPEEARVLALRSFGNFGRIKELAYEIRGGGIMETIWQDLRFGLRMLAKSPGFTLVAVLTLALGIGANTAIFSVVNAVLLRPLPYPESEGLVRIWEDPGNIAKNFVNPRNYADFRDQNQIFEQVAAISTQSTNLTGEGEPERVINARVASGFFSILRINPALGRTFLPQEDQTGNEHVAVLSHSLWQRRFGADPKAIGQTLMLNGESLTIIGVMPAGFSFPVGIDLWTPLVFTPEQMADSSRGSHFLSVIGRLKPQRTVEQAQAEMDTIYHRLRQQHPESLAKWKVHVFSMYQDSVGGVKSSLFTLLGAVCFVLLIACANVANLMLARATTRQREISIRTALGASRARLIRQLLTESVLLALVGGALGVLLGWGGIKLLVHLDPGTIPRLDEIDIDRSVLIFTSLLSLLSGVIFGLAPAWQSSKIDLNKALKEATGRGSIGGGQAYLRQLFVVAEVALSLVLLVGAGLMIRSFIRLGQVELGFNPENVMAMRVALPRSRYADRPPQIAFYRQVVERVKALPGVQSAALVSDPPISGSVGLWQNGFGIEGRPALPPGQGNSAYLRWTTPDYFKTLGISLLKGRLLTEADNQDTPWVTVIDEAMARRYFPNEDPLGKRVVVYWSEQRPREIVGVVSHVRQTSLDYEAGPHMYIPYYQTPLNYATLLVKTPTDSTALAASIKSEVLAVDRQQPVYAVTTMKQIIAASIAERRFHLTLLGIFAGVALVLATVGIYGVMSYAVTQRTPEIGIRLALGAQASDVLKLVIGRGLLLTVIGVGIGLAAAFALTRLMSGLLFGVSPTDPMTFTGIALLLTLVSLLACYLPARRATKVDPMVALRYE